MGKNIYFQSQFFSLKVKSTDTQTSIRMQVDSNYINTKNIPNTLPFLDNFFPSVFETQCFNENNFPFRIEAQATEFGHLFEHILLDQMCILKLEDGVKTAVFNGRTKWNWEKDPLGVFHITIDVGKKDESIFALALNKTIELSEGLLRSSINFIPPTVPVPQLSLSTPNYGQPFLIARRS